MNIGKVLQLWSIYNQKLVELHQKNKFAIIKFDLDNPDLYIDTVAQAAIEIGLNPDLKLMSECVSQELLQEKRELELIPESCMNIYNYLEDNCFKNSADTYSFDILKLKKDLIQMEEHSN